MTRFLLLLALLMPASSYAELDVVDAWINDLPPSVPVRAGYMTLHNSGESTLNILSVQSDAFAQIEIHRSVMQDGMMRMEPITTLSIAPGSTVHLAPGGYHLMMMQPLRPTRPGDNIDVVLHLDDGSEKHLTMTVVKQ